MPTNEELYAEAENLKDTGQTEAAIAKLQQLLAQDESYALAHSTLAVLFRRLSRFDEAVGHARRVCELEPNDPFNFTALSVEYQRAGKIAEAEEAMARARMLQGGMH